MTDQTILSISGGDRRDFLQGLISNDMARADEGIAYAALLTPQGKLIADFFVIGRDDCYLVDVASSVAPALFQRLSMYKLRADVQITESPLKVFCGTGTPPDNALRDPRHAALGWRLYGDEDGDDGTDWTALRVAHLIPETGIELGPETYLREAGFERLNGLDYKKGCYVGQEVAARMKHKTEMRKGLARVSVDGSAPPGTAITSDGKPAGTLHSRSGDEAIAFLRFDRAQGPMEAGDATLRLIEKAV